MISRMIQSLVAAFLVLCWTANDASGQYLPDNAFYWWMTTDDGVVHYILEIGDHTDPDRTFVVLHGGPGADHSYLIDMVAPLADSYRFILYDQRGSLRTEAPDSLISHESLAADLDAIRREFGLETLNLVGHSYGANVALDYLATHPDRVRRLVLISAPPSAVHPAVLPASEHLLDRWQKGQQAFAMQAAEATARKRRELGVQEVAGLSQRERAVRGRIELAAYNTTNAANWRTVRGAFFNPTIGPRIHGGLPAEVQLAQMRRWNEAIRGTGAPVQVVIGEQDLVDPEGILWRAGVEHVRNGTLIMVPDAGHLPWIDRPGQFSEILREILAEPNR